MSSKQEGRCKYWFPVFVFFLPFVSFVRTFFYKFETRKFKGDFSQSSQRAQRTQSRSNGRIMKLAFSTLGCPQWGLKKIAAAARTYGYDSIELRALEGSLNLLDHPELQSTVVEQTRAFFNDEGLSICSVDTSCAFHAMDELERRENIETAVRYAELAARLGAPLVRVFPNEVPAGAKREATRDRIVNSLGELVERMPTGVRVGLETHGDFAAGSATADIVRRVAHPNLVIIWDVANSFAAEETIAASAQAVAPYLAHVHLRDAKPQGEGRDWLPTLTGQGQVPLTETISVLRGMNYEGYVSFEWEKYWHPEIAEPEVALPDFIAAVRAYGGAEKIGGVNKRG
jgi:sugar phosphate isomerase/epimerase